MFTEKAQATIDLAKNAAFASGSKVLDLPSWLFTFRAQSEALVRLAESWHLTSAELARRCPSVAMSVDCPGKLALTAPVRSLLETARFLAGEVPDRVHPGWLNIRHLAAATATSAEAAEAISVKPIDRDQALALLSLWADREARSPRLGELTERLRGLRSELLARIFGQDHAVQAFIDGLFNAEVVAAADNQRQAPRALFVFAGPPGVGKTYLAELGASRLDRPFKRFDMSSYADAQQHNELVGWAKSFQGARPGTLTEFVEQNPNGILLFDEIEKAHLNTIHLFLQLLDAGILADKYHERNVRFRDTIIIFTTNAGRKLYDQPNESGVHLANAAFHRQTILEALETEKDPRTGKPFFPPAICSRLATGCPILFNQLGVMEMEHVAQAELERVAGLLERQYHKCLEFDALVPLCLVLREGARVDARRLKSQVEIFVKTEFFRFCQLFNAERLEATLAQVDRFAFRVEGAPLGVAGLAQPSGRDSDLFAFSTHSYLAAIGKGPGALPPEIRALFEPEGKPKVLLVADNPLRTLFSKRIASIDWQTADNVDDALEILAQTDVDLAIIDLWVGTTAGAMNSLRPFDRAPAAARGLAKGQELLRKIRARLPSLPIFLLSRAQGNSDVAASEGDNLPRGPGAPPASAGMIDEDLFLACVRAGGARGLIASEFRNETSPNWEAEAAQFTRDLLSICYRIHREKSAHRLAQERRVLSFETAPELRENRREVRIRLRNLALARAVAADDAGEILSEVDRPKTRFEDVIGADTAKEELGFFIDYLRNPRRFAALGLKPPRGVLLHGPPGTGKTMLARAMAGESEVAFISAAASGFVTMWQGSGPQAIRELFARARRYAPSIIFIDEIDTIGKVRTGSHGGGQAEETTLNALLTEMDGFTGPALERPVFVLAATNFRVEADQPDLPERSSRTLDPALVRRFARCVLVDLPDTAVRQRYFSRRLAEGGNALMPESALVLLAEKSAGMSIANLEQVIETAGRHAVKSGSRVSAELLLEVLDTLREGEAKEWSPECLESTAIHEAGHTVMYWLAGWISPEVTIVARADRGGGLRRCEAELRRENLTREEMLARIRTCLGGRAAELLLRGVEQGLTTGASGDLEHATHLARQILCLYGMDEDFGLASLPELLRQTTAAGNPLVEQLIGRVNRLLRDQMEKTLDQLRQQRATLEAVARELRKKNRLYRQDLENLLPKTIP